MVKQVAEKLGEKRYRLSVAESCTGGFISHSITNLPGSSDFFDVGVVSYSEESKKSILGISAFSLRKHGTISEETAIAMAKGIKKMSGTRVSLAITGIAGPETIEGKEIGLIFMAVAIGDHIESQGMKLTGEREEIKIQASLEALKFLNQVLRIWL